MKVSDVMEMVDGRQTAGSSDVEVAGLAYDSRQVRPGFMFVAVAGYKQDGTDYIADAIANGASVVVSEADFDLGAGVAHIHVPCARRALAEIAKIYYENVAESMDIVGITGTNGKTTTAYMIRNLLKAAGRKPGLIGTVAYEIGERTIPASRTTPEAPDLHAMFQQMKRVGCDCVVMEVSSHAITLQRVYGIDFKAGVFTNLTQDHLDFHHDIDSYFDTKAAFMKSLSEKAFAVVNMDDPWGRKLLDDMGSKADLVSYGFHEKAMVRAFGEKVSETGCSFKIDSPWGTTKVRLQLLGRFNIHNALAAFAAGGSMGFAPRKMAEVLSDIQNIPGRLERIPNRRKKKVFVDYAHTDDALKNVLTTLREVTKGKLILVFGCGGNRDRGKRLLMGRVAAEFADYSIVTNDNPRYEDPEEIAKGIVEGFSDGQQYSVVLDRKQAILKGIEMIGRKDVLLIAGKGHETYQEFSGTIVPFDDREIVKELIG